MSQVTMRGENEIQRSAERVQQGQADTRASTRHRPRADQSALYSILMLAQFYPPMIGGEERHVRNLSLELVSRGYDVAVATLWQEGLPEFEDDQGVRVYRIRSAIQRAGALFQEKERRHAPPFPDPGTLWELRRLIADLRPDIVHAHNWMLHSFTPLKMWGKAKLVVTQHDCSLVCVKQQYTYRGEMCDGPGPTKCLGCAVDHYGVARGVPLTLAHHVGRKVEEHVVDMFLPVSQAIAEANLFDERELPYRIIPNFVPDDVATPPTADAELLAQLPQEDFLLFVGSVGHSKGVHVLLDAYTQMTNPPPLVLIGTVEPGFPLELPENVYQLEKWPHAAVMNAWRRCSIALIPSVCPDACPTVAMEAMAMSRPIIASRIGGLPDIVRDGETGFLLPPGDSRALAQAIQSLLDDPLLRERMGARAKQRVIEFQAATVIPRIEQVYQEVLQP